MPCDYSNYPKNWKGIRSIVLARARDRCEQCGKPNREDVVVGPEGVWFDPDFGWLGLQYGQRAPLLGETRKIMVVLTVSHSCHDSRCDDLTHMRALCQRCHLVYDKALHVKHTRETRRERLAIADLYTQPGVYSCGCRVVEGAALCSLHLLKVVVPED